MAGIGQGLANWLEATRKRSGSCGFGPIHKKNVGEKIDIDVILFSLELRAACACVDAQVDNRWKGR